jgi:hypothetical protein
MKRWLATLHSHNALAWLLALALLGVYALLPDANDAGESARSDDAAEDSERLEIIDVSPHDPYPGGTIAIRYAVPTRAAPESRAEHEPKLEVFGSKLRLRILAQRGEQIVAELPQDMPLGDLKVRIASLPDDATRTRSKPFHIRVRPPSYRKLFRSFVGGVALVVLGVFFLARGVRGATSLHAARLLAGVSQRRGILLGLGALLGALAQSTTGAVGLLSGLVSSNVISVTPAAIACLSAPLGAALAPLLVAGLIEPREGLLIVALGVLWLLLARGRRWQALAGLVLGSGLLAFGLHVFRPALEPFLADAAVWRLAGELRAQGLLDYALCAGLGALAVALMHGPAPLIVLLLGIAQATQHADLRTLLALLSGTSAGAALAGLITAPASPRARVLARTHLYLGLLGSLLALLSVELWVRMTERWLGPLALPLHWTIRAPVSELGLRLSLCFGLSQLAVCLALAPLASRVCAVLGEPRPLRDATLNTSAGSAGVLQALFDHVLRAQQSGLNQVSALALSGERRRGQEAELSLGEARREVERLLERGQTQSATAPQLDLRKTQGLDALAFSLLQLQNALDHLLHQTERMVDAQIAGLSLDTGPSAPAFDKTPIEDLHRLLCESLEAARQSLTAGEPLDIDAARSREIQMNRIEASTRGVLLAREPAPEAHESRLRVLQVVDAYEASGNQVYRLAELLSQQTFAPTSTAQV